MKRHGHAQEGNRSPTYGVWLSMKQRCLNSNDPAYVKYGGRGITVCERWLKFENFLEDMGEQPKSLTLDRIDNNGGYHKGNCRWATRREQSANTRIAKLITHAGKTFCIAEWARQFGLNEGTFRARLLRGWSIERALNVPLQGRR